MTEDVRELAEDTDAVAVRRRPTGTAARRRCRALRRRGRASSEGETAEVAVDTRSLHFFDPETGLGIYDAAEASRKELTA